MQELRTDRYKLKELFPEKAKKYAQKLKTKATELEFIRKGIPIDPKDIEIKEGERAAIRLVTTPHLDRDGEILMPHGAMLDDFRQSPSVLYAHDYKGLPVGHDQWIKPVKEGILAKTLYAIHQFAEDVYQCVKHKDLNANSVGFIPVEAVTPEDKKLFGATQEVLEKDYGISKDESGKAKNIYTKWIMLEHSDVPVASNAQSLNLAISKGELVIQSDRLKKDLEIEVVKDREIEVVVEEDEVRYAKVKEYTEGIPKDGIFTKPETIGQYHHIPVNPGCKITATITISAEKGIKATYCGKIKKIHTYLFDVKKWTMAEAQAWVKENHKRELEEYIQKIVESEPQYKERWNKSFSKLFDIASAESSTPLRFHYGLYEKFLECKVKEIFQNGYVIPSPLLGTYLAGFKKILAEFKLKDTRKFVWDGSEVPPSHEVIQLNSEKSDDFLIDGMCFYEAEAKPLIVNFSPDYYGLIVTLTTSTENKEWNKELLDKVHSWVYENNFLRGEKFSLSGEFLHEPDDDWDNLILDEKYKDSIRKSANFLEKKGKEFTGRGLLFIGPPGTGKTKTGRVLMNELDATFIWVSSKDFRYVGPLKALALGFSLARDLAPSVLFLEDIDTWLRGEMEYVTDLIKTEMDGIKQNRGIITILTSNYPEKLPDALLDRPGRFHHIVNFELPKEKQRSEMLKLWAGEIGEDLLKEITEKTDGFSGAHIKELVEFAKMIAEEDAIEISEALLKSLNKLIEQRELIEEIKGNQTQAKEFWAKVKWIDGDIEIKKDREIEIEELTEFDKKLKKLVEECEHDWIDVTRKDEKHIREYTCPKCGLMKREPIESADYTGLEFAIKDLTGQITELKEGRVLSTKNRTLVKDTIDALTTLKEKLGELYEATEPPVKDDEKQNYNCECIECGYKMASDEHCNDIECPKCGGEMRRVERPGPGKERKFILEKDNKEDDLDKKITNAVERLFQPDKIGKMMSDAIKEALDVGIKKRLGKVE